MHSTKDFFISYGRRESLGFVARLHRALILEGYTGWFDKVNIPDGEAYDKRISNGIESADNFVFVMAPRCLTSPYCLVELEYARALGKRIIPINQMVIFQTEEQELSAGDQAVLKGFYKANNIPNPNITTTQQVLDRSLALIGTTDWLDGKQHLTDEACEKLRAWAGTYENSWHNHEDAEYLKQHELPVFGEVTDSTESIVERIVLVAEKQKAYVKQHNLLTLDALQWANNQKLNNYLLVGKERKAAEEWLLTEFTPPKQPPCTPSDLLCEFISEARKNAENRMTDVFVCYAAEEKEIRNQIIKALARYAITTWTHDKDIQKGTTYGKAIEAGIESADNFFFFISPESVKSEYCLKELQHALKYNKRLVPLLIKPTLETDIPEALRALQHIDFTDNTDLADFLSDIDEILNVLNHDRSYYEEHKVLLTRTLQWENSGRKNAFLLRGFNLENASTWLRIHDKRTAHPPLEMHREFIRASEAAKGQLNTDVFISYSRKDGDFARQLNRKLQENGKNTWFDQESISTGVDFEKEIFKGIAGADNIVFLLSPDSVQSEYCEREVEYAASLGKRFITLLVRNTEPSDIPETLRVINWIDFSASEFDKPFAELVKEVELDREHVHKHTLFQQRALEWDEHDQSPDFLLNGTATKTALTWLDEAEGKKPQPTERQRKHIQESEAAIKAAARAARKRQRQIILVVSIAALFSLGFGIFGLVEMKQANRNLKAAKLYSRRADDARRKANEKQKEALEQKKRAEQALKDLEAKQAELEREKQVALEAKDFAEVKRIEAEQAKLRTEQALKSLEIEKENALKAKDFAEVKRIEAEQAKLQAEKQALRSFVLLKANTAKDWAQDGKATTNTDAAQMLLTVADSLKSIGMALPPAFSSTVLQVEEAISQQGKITTRYVGHKSGVKAATFSPDGTKIVTGGNDSTVTLWDLKGNRLQDFKVATNQVFSIAFSPDGTKILTGIANQTATLWDLKGNRLQDFKGHTSYVFAVAFSPDGTKVLTGSEDKTAILWDLKGNRLQQFKGHTAHVMSVAFSPDGNKIVTGSYDDTAILWDLNGKRLQDFKGHTDKVRAAVFSPDGNKIVTGSLDNTAILWDTSGKRLQDFKGHTDFVFSVAFSPDGTKILTGSRDDTAILWDLEGNRLQDLKGHTDYVMSAVFSADGKKALTGSRDNTAILWDLYTPSTQSFKGHTNNIKSVAFSPDGTKVLTGGEDNKAILWDLKGNRLKDFVGHTEKINAVAFSPDGAKVLTGSDDNSAILWDLKGNRLQNFDGDGSYIKTVAFSPDGTKVLTGSLNNTAILWDLNGNRLQNFIGHTRWVNSVAFSPDGTKILTGASGKFQEPGEVFLWDIKGKRLQSFIGHTNEVTSVAFSPDGKSALSGSKDKTVILWDLAGNALQTFKGHMSFVNSVAFSTDGTKILTGGDGVYRKPGEVFLWDLHGNLLKGFKGYMSPANSVAFSPDGTKVLAGGEDKTALLWNTPKGILKKWETDTFAPLLPETLSGLELLPAPTHLLKKPKVEQYWHALYHYEQENYAEAKLLFANLWTMNYYFSESMLWRFKGCLEASLRKEESEKDRALLNAVKTKLQ